MYASNASTRGFWPSSAYVLLLLRQGRLLPRARLLQQRRHLLPVARLLRQGRLFPMARLLWFVPTLVLLEVL